MSGHSQSSIVTLVSPPSRKDGRSLQTLSHHSGIVAGTYSQASYPVPCWSPLGLSSFLLLARSKASITLVLESQLACTLQLSIGPGFPSLFYPLDPPMVLLVLSGPLNPASAAKRWSPSMICLRMGSSCPLVPTPHVSMSTYTEASTQLLGHTDEQISTTHTSYQRRDLPQK